MKINKKKPIIFVLGNEKGGAGKTTCSMHLIAGLLDKNYKVTSIDTDSRQHSLTRYIENRDLYNKNNKDHQVDVPMHHHIDSKDDEQSIADLTAAIEGAEDSDYIIIDTPGAYSTLSAKAHSYADTIITPINDSFIDLDVIAKIEGGTLQVDRPSIYSQMIWEQKMERATRDGGSIEWLVVRNRLSNLNAKNKQDVASSLDRMSKRFGFEISSGFSERVIFRELFPYGLTLLDLKKANYVKSLSMSHVTARQELRVFLKALGIS